MSCEISNSTELLMHSSSVVFPAIFHVTSDFRRMSTESLFGCPDITSYIIIFILLLLLLLLSSLFYIIIIIIILILFWDIFTLLFVSEETKT